MSKYHSFVDTVDQIVTDGVKKGILHLYNEDTSIDGNNIILKGRKAVNFGSCSYLGLEFDKRMIKGAKEAIDRFGTQFSESRAYVSLGTYNELENLLEQIFEAHVVVVPTTTLGHIGAIPVLVGDGDAVILDHQVHNSIQNAVNLLKPRGIHVELIRHNRMDLLEERIKVLRQTKKNIWYMADGIYSMYGDKCPVNDIYRLMDQYPELHFYVDDAHGMSCYGKHGRGFVLSENPIRDRMVMATSMNKAFASGGGVLVFKSQELARRVRTCSAPLLSSGPMQPSGLGAAIAAAKIHLSDEIYKMQEELHENLKYTNLLLRKHGLPVASDTNSPVFFVGVSLPKLGYNMVRRMLDNGYYVNLGIFPVVPMKNTGVRFTITRLHTFKQIEEMVATMAEQFYQAIQEEGITLEQIYKAFKILMPEHQKIETMIADVVQQSQLKVHEYNSIQDVDKAEWNSIYQGKGNFDWDGLNFLENCFSTNIQPEDNWVFDYITIKDLSGNIVLAAFFTTALWKDDMLSNASISEQIEELRKKDPYYLTSKITAVGSLLSEGEHLYLNKESELWKPALRLLLEKISQLQEKYNSAGIIMRDFENIKANEELDSFFVDNGYFKVSMPDTHIVSSFDWQNPEEYYAQLTRKSKKNMKKDVLNHLNSFEISFEKSTDKKTIDTWYEMYMNVKNKNLELNTFALPYKVFENVAGNSNWDVLTLKIKETGEDAAVVFSYISGNTYIPVMVGLDYKYQEQYKPYKQALYQLVMRAKNLNMKKMHLGFAATIEKRKVGAAAIATCAYMQTKDNYSLEVLGSMTVNTNKKKEKEVV